MSKHTPRQIHTAHDFVPTPEVAVLPLAKWLPIGMKYYEPCAGDGALVKALEKHAMIECAGASDLAPRQEWIVQCNALHLTGNDIGADTQCLITNPPWEVGLLHPLLEHLVSLRPTWLLLYSDWLFTRQAAPYLPLVARVITMPRVIWISGTKKNGKSNVCWVLFSQYLEDKEVGFLSGWK